MVPKGEASGSCVLCHRYAQSICRCRDADHSHRPIQEGVQHWKDRIAIRSRPKSSSTSRCLDETHHLASHLCYVCHTNLTSKGARPAPPLYSRPPDSSLTTLPFWTSTDIGAGGNAVATGSCDAAEAVGGTRRFTKDELQETIKGFLLNDE